MQIQEKIPFKARLKEFGLALIGERLDAARIAMDQAQQAANSEEKSSAGDKYETGRAMGHLQKEMYARQMGAYTKELSALHAVNTDHIYTSAVAGAVVDCGEVVFFIAAGLGKQDINGRTIFFVAPQAPITRQLAELQSGGTLEFNKKTLIILEVY